MAWLPIKRAAVLTGRWGMCAMEKGGDFTH